MFQALSVLGKLFRTHGDAAAVPPPPFPRGAAAALSPHPEEAERLAPRPQNAVRAECIGTAFFIRYVDARGGASARQDSDARRLRQTPAEMIHRASRGR